MLIVALKRSPAETYGMPQPTPITIVAGAFRRALVRVFEIGRRDRDALERAIEYSGDLDCLLAQHDVRHAKHVDGSRRVFRAPELVYFPPVHRQPVRGSRTKGAAAANAPRLGHHSR